VPPSIIYGLCHTPLHRWRFSRSHLRQRIRISKRGRILHSSEPNRSGCIENEPIQEQDRSGFIKKEPIRPLSDRSDLYQTDPFLCNIPVSPEPIANRWSQKWPESIRPLPDRSASVKKEPIRLPDRSASDPDRSALDKLWQIVDQIFSAKEFLLKPTTGRWFS